jgi:hypothetical protein
MIELTASWDDLDTIPDPCWVSTKDFADTGEQFGLKKEIVGGTDTGEDPSVELTEENSRRQLELELCGVVEAIEEGNDGVADHDDDVIATSEVLPKSAAWVSRQLQTKRGFGPVSTPEEKEMFRKHHHEFNGDVLQT